MIYNNSYEIDPTQHYLDSLRPSDPEFEIFQNTFEPSGNLPARGLIESGVELSGSYPVQTSKLISSILFQLGLASKEGGIVRKFPKIRYMDQAIRLARASNAKVTTDLDDSVEFNGSGMELPSIEAMHYVSQKDRSTALLMNAAYISHGGFGYVPDLTGGDPIDIRRTDLHSWVLEQLGAELKPAPGGKIIDASEGLKPANIDFREVSVGATQQLIMNAPLAIGTTIARNFAQTPEIDQLIDAVNYMGATAYIEKDENNDRSKDELVIVGNGGLGYLDITPENCRLDSLSIAVLAAMSKEGKVFAEGARLDDMPSAWEAYDELGGLAEPVEGGVNFSRKPEDLSARDLSARLSPELDSDSVAILTGLIAKYLIESNYVEESESFKIHDPYFRERSAELKWLRQFGLIFDHSGDCLDEECFRSGAWGHAAYLSNYGREDGIKQPAIYDEIYVPTSMRLAFMVIGLAITDSNIKREISYDNLGYIESGYERLGKRFLDIGANIRPNQAGVRLDQRDYAAD